jgi:flagellar protein FlaF
MGLSAYKQTIKNTESPRAVERRILNQVTARLERHGKEFDETDNKRERLAILDNALREALQDNIRLWNAFQSDLLKSDNALPDADRAGLISLSKFIEKRTSLALKGEGTISTLVGINRQIIQGLQGQAPEAA